MKKFNANERTEMEEQEIKMKNISIINRINNKIKPQIAGERMPASMIKWEKKMKRTKMYRATPMQPKKYYFPLDSKTLTQPNDTKR